MGHATGREPTWTCGRCNKEHPLEQVPETKCPVCDWRGGTMPFRPKHRRKLTINLERDVG